MNNYRNILLPVDFSKTSSAAVNKLKAMSAFSDATITILHVVTYVPPGYASVELPKNLGSPEYLVGHAKEHMREWCEQHGLQDCKKTVVSGSAKRIILEKAKELDIDLIIIGEGRENMITRAFGSVASAVIHDSHCDVLVVRT